MPSDHSSDRGSLLPVAVGLCPDPAHTDQWFMPLGSEESKICPECSLALVVYVRKHKPRREPNVKKVYSVAPWTIDEGWTVE